MKDFILVHSDEYNNWVFDPTHPTQGRRFINAKNSLLRIADAEQLNYEVVDTRKATFEELDLVHDVTYIQEVEYGYSDEWDGVRLDLGDLALKFAGGTVVALEHLVAGDTLTAIHFAGAKHHAQYDRSSGFCVFADLALVATLLSQKGNKVAILDVDAHHGDGTQNLTYEDKNILTYSIHERDIFPFSGNEYDLTNKVFNLPLGAHSTSAMLRLGVSEFIGLAEEHKPDYILIAGGADGHRTDPLSSLQYEISSAANALSRVRSAFPTTPILFGGAGGYQPDTATPEMWACMAIALVRGDSE